MRIHKRRNPMGDHRQIVNNAGVGEPRIERLEVRDNRLPPPYVDRPEPKRPDTRFSYLVNGQFEQRKMTEHEAKRIATKGTPIFYGSVGKDGKPRGLRVKP